MGRCYEEIGRAEEALGIMKLWWEFGAFDLAAPEFESVRNGS